MIVNFQGGPVGLETLAAAIGEDSGTLEDVYEPYLLQNGFLNRTPRGRMASALAYERTSVWCNCLACNYKNISKSPFIT